MYYVSILSTNKGEDHPQYLLDGNPLDVDWICVQKGFGCDYMYTNFAVEEGIHSIESVSRDTFLGWSYAYERADGYGSIIGLSGNKTQRRMENLRF